MGDDRKRLEVLERAECLRLLGQQCVGRIGLSFGALPVVLPVNYVLDGDRLVVRTGGGSKFAAALRNAVVCFEVDRLDHGARTGWSVLVTGTARELVGPEAAEAAALPLDPWITDAGVHLVAISVELIAGRRLGGARRGHALESGTAQRTVVPIPVLAAPT